MDDAAVRHSLAYRRHEAAILAGRPPEKYLRLLPHIPRGRILEVGSAEGVLALLLAQRGDSVTAVERSVDRHDAARKLRGEWQSRGFLGVGVDTDITYVSGDARTAISIFEPGVYDAFLAVRAIYYFGDQLDLVFKQVVDAKIPNVVLCGNKNLARRNTEPERQGR
jgi:protein-L-isoaspartate O-methyltransferase